MKERKRSKILGLMLAVCMVLTMTISGLGALQVLAVEGDTSPLTKVIVGGVEMYSASGATYYVNGATTAVTTEPNNWNAKYENGILTIKNLSVVGAAADHKFAGIYATTALAIDVQGANSVTGADCSGVTYGIYIAGALTIQGDGALSVTGGTISTSGSSYGISTTTGNNISITENVVVNATGGTAGTTNGSGGISCGGTLSIEGNATVNATGGSAGNTYGIYSKYMTVTGGVTVATGGTASGTALTSYGIGISSFGDATVTTTGGVLVARAGSGETTKAIDGTLTTNGTKIAGQVVNNTFAGSPASYDGNATAVAIVPSDFADGSTLNFSSALDQNYYIVKGDDALELSTETSVSTNGNTLLAVSLYSGDSVAHGIKGSFTASGSGSVISVAGTGVNSTGTGSYGIMGDLTINGATVTAIGGPGGRGVNGKYDNSSTDPSVKVLSGWLNAIGGSNGNTSHGIEVSRSIVVSGGVVNAVGGRAANGEGYGIKGDLQITDGTVNAVSGPSSATSYGVRGDVTATGGTLNAVGGPSSTNSYGIYISKNMSISNTSKVTATGGTYGLYTSYSLAAGSLAAGSYSGGSNAVKNSVSGSTANTLLAGGYGYFAGNTQLTPGSSVTVGDPYQVVTVKEIPDPHEHPVCGSSHTDIGNHTGSCTDVTWTPVYSEADLGNMTAGGSYYLANDITLTHTLYVSSVNLCLNGFTLERTSSGHAIELNREAIFNLCDCSVGQTGTIDGGSANDYAGIVCYNENTLNIYGGTITGCQKGAAIGVMYSGTANIYNGNITGNNGGYGGVYCFNGATLNIYGGTITNNTADYAGGGIWLHESTLTISGDVKISGNTLNGEENNVHIEANDSDPSVITVGALSSDAKVGVTIGDTGYKEVAPGNYEQYVEFLEGTVSATGADYIDNFFSDVDGYKIVAKGQGLELVKIIEAKWGSSADSLTESGTLADALSEAERADTDVYIQLQSDAELVRPYSFENGVDVMITLDLNGHDISASFSGYNLLFGVGYVGSGGSTYGNLTLTDTSSGDRGSITANANIVYMCHGSTLRIGGGISVVSAGGYALRFEGGTVTVEEGGFSATSADSNAIYMNGATLNGNNIPFTAITNSDYYSTAAIYVDQGDVTGLNATVTGPTALSLGHSWYPSKFFNVEITGGTYTGTQYYAIVINNESGENSSLSLKGGTFVADTEADGVINLYDSGTVLNTYGALLADNYVYTDEAGSMAIKNETKLAEARTLVVKSVDDVPAGKLIVSIEKISTEGLVDTYRITYDDGSTYDFTVTNGADGSNGLNGNNGQDGSNGVTPTFKLENDVLCVSYDNGTSWTELGNIGGTDGNDGQDGQDGTDGVDGIDGKTPSFKVENGNLYVRYSDTEEWTLLGNIQGANGSDGADGSNGQNGTNGVDGKTPTFKIENGELKVSYDNGATWTSLGTVKGADGADGRNGSSGSNGKDGKDGKDGITPQLRINLETNEWEVSYDNGATWTSLGVKATGDKGDKGDKGDTGAAGKDGIDGKDGVDGKDGEVVTNGTDILVVVAIIISSIALIGEIVFLVYVIVQKKRTE